MLILALVRRATREVIQLIRNFNDTLIQTSSAQWDNILRIEHRTSALFKGQHGYTAS